MDNFDLRKYLTEGRLFKNEMPHKDIKEAFRFGKGEEKEKTEKIKQTNKEKREKRNEQNKDKRENRKRKEKDKEKGTKGQRDSVPFKP